MSLLLSFSRGPIIGIELGVASHESVVQVKELKTSANLYTGFSFDTTVL
jgi:hypothetical protein